jgi:pyruvate, water dikinase
MDPYILPFDQINLASLPQAGGKNASLGEMFNKLTPLGIEVPDGFAVTVASFRAFLDANQLTEVLKKLLDSIDNKSLSNLPEIALQCRELVSKGKLPPEISREIIKGYRMLCKDQDNVSVAVRSSATAEDLPTASFAGQHESFLNIQGEENVLDAVVKCYVSLFYDRAIKYRIDNGFEHMKVGLSAGVQYMVRSDLACSGVNFTIDPESGFDKTVYITGAWGLGENIVQGAVIPDEFWVFKPTLLQGKNALISRKKGDKENTMVYDESGH